MGYTVANTIVMQESEGCLKSQLHQSCAVGRYYPSHCPLILLPNLDPGVEVRDSSRYSALLALLGSKLESERAVLPSFSDSSPIGIQVGTR